MERLYRELASWFPLLTPPEEYADEAERFADTMERRAVGLVREVLELGSGGGHTASHLKKRFEITLTDLSADMIAQSTLLNPECVHVQGDMRSLRLDRSFDAVLVADAVMYQRTEADLAATIGTAAAHLRPGGVALFVPDFVKETFSDRSFTGGSDGDDRAMRYLEWDHDPDPDDTEITTTFVYVFREAGKPVRVEHEDHHIGLFPRTTWIRLIESAGLKPIEEASSEYGESLFTGLKP